MDSNANNLYEYASKTHPPTPLSPLKLSNMRPPIRVYSSKKEADEEARRINFVDPPIRVFRSLYPH
ncbi:hypothetical protein BVRB_7g180040 [Beta vulgaris subsp. vulgaris]|uniref:Uncharacterized protein n=1 Tax=Beta vulgaris subsp. vulgaris TaxID=3555 RepID=A0A0J8B7I1_BETVV|nr:hypothetical protein BVRB_7g180040 [Beta vulgaris subsp. vulgaris]